MRSAECGIGRTRALKGLRPPRSLFRIPHSAFPIRRIPMAWSLAPRLLRYRPAEEPLVYDDVPEFPAGVVALGRGGAGEIGALLREDGVYVGLLSLAAGPGRTMDDVAELARALPLGACQVVTTRWP